MVRTSIIYLVIGVALMAIVPNQGTSATGYGLCEGDDSTASMERALDYYYQWGYACALKELQVVMDLKASTASDSADVFILRSGIAFNENPAADSSARRDQVVDAATRAFVVDPNWSGELPSQHQLYLAWIESARSVAKVVREARLADSSAVHAMTDCHIGEGLVDLSNVPDSVLVKHGGLELGYTPLEPQCIPRGYQQIVLKRAHFETCKTHISVSARSIVSVTYHAIPKTRRGAVLRSVAIPGWGQLYAERKSRALLFVGGQVAAAGFFLVSRSDYYSKESDYETADQAYWRAIGTPDETPAYDARNTAWEKLSSASKLNNLAVGLLVGVYVANVIDACFYKGPEAEGRDSQSHLGTSLQFDNGGLGLALKWSLR